MTIFQERIDCSIRALVKCSFIGLSQIGEIDGLAIAWREVNVAQHLVALGPLHSRCTAKVAPSRFLLRIVQRPNTESMSRAVIVTRDTSDPPPVHGVFSVYVPTIVKSSSPSTCVVIVASVTMPSILAAIGIWFHRVTVLRGPAR
jgi:hypothetical protein